MVGRGSELDALAQELDTVLNGKRRVVVLGEAGIGKTTLVEHWLERSLGRLGVDAPAVLRASAEEAEGALAWGVLGQVLAGLARLDGEETWRHPAPEADPLSVGQGLLARLGALADRGVVVVVAEDLH